MPRKSIVALMFALIVPAYTLADEAVPAGVAKPVNERFAANDVQEVPDFQRHVVPVLGRMGCNGRACHGSFQGQGGFRLSLFGYDFKLDHEALLKKTEKPRIDLEVPDASLILGKATLTVPHKGGRRMDVDGWEYRLIERWIEAGAKGRSDEAAHFVKLEVQPTQIVFTSKGTKTQLKVTAHWSDGSQEDVTPLCRYRTNNEAIADVNESGVITSTGVGDTHIVAFYDNGVAPVETILPVSEQIGPKYPAVPAPTKVDSLVVDKLRRLGVVPSDVAGDAEFLRRVSLDITGTLPTPAEIEAFLADSTSEKRARKIDELLERPAYAAWWATRLCDITGNNPQTFEERNIQNEMGRQWFTWIEKRLQENIPYDRLVERIFVSASREAGQDYTQYSEQMTAYYRKESPADFSTRETMPHYWARRTFKNPEDRAMGFAYSFLGVRLQCAQCHKHPYDQWTQEDFNQFKSFFNRVAYGVQKDGQEKMKELQKSLGKDQKKNAALVQNGQPYPWKEVFVGPARVKQPPKDKTKPKEKKPAPSAPVSVTARLLGGDEVELDAQVDPRTLLMTWMREKNNPYFARAFVNRVWAAYFGVGIIEPADDLNLANPPSNGPLLDYLAEQFAAHNFDMKWLHREIANSRTYQLTWKPNDTNKLDTRNFSHAYPRRLPAEVTYDAILQAISTQDEMKDASQHPDTRAIAQSPPARKGKAVSNYALAVFGRPARATNCDCERSNEPSLLQTIYLQNDQEFASALQRSGWLNQVDSQLNPKQAPKSPADIVRDRSIAVEKATKQLEKMEADQQKLAEKEGKPNEALDKKVATAKERLADLKAVLVKAEEAAAAPKVEPIRVADQPTELVREAYLRTVSRPPTEAELARGLQYISESSGTVSGLRDLLWALLNTKEFIVNH